MSPAWRWYAVHELSAVPNLSRLPSFLFPMYGHVRFLTVDVILEVHHSNRYLCIYISTCTTICLYVIVCISARCWSSIFLILSLKFWICIGNILSQSICVKSYADYCTLEVNSFSSPSLTSDDSRDMDAFSSSELIGTPSRDLTWGRLQTTNSL